jgi:hypothetical protein
VQPSYDEPQQSEVCRAYDEMLQQAQRRLWLAVPWVYSHRSDAWLTELVEGVAALARHRCEVRAYLRPSQHNAHTVAAWRAAGVRVIQDTPAVRYLHANSSSRTTWRC